MKKNIWYLFFAVTIFVLLTSENGIKKQCKNATTNVNNCNTCHSNLTNTGDIISQTTKDTIINNNPNSNPHTTAISDLNIDATSVLLYPNPASQSVQINFDVNMDCNLSIQLLNIEGKNVLPICNQHFNKGSFFQKLVLPQYIPSGIYVIAFKTSSVIFTKYLSIK